MSKRFGCFGCYFYESGHMWNQCKYFESEYFHEPDDCLAFSIDGHLSKGAEAQIFDETDGVFGEPRDAQQVYEVRQRYGES